jgi:hypothetical protein
MAERNDNGANEQKEYQLPRLERRLGFDGEPPYNFREKSRKGYIKAALERHDIKEKAHNTKIKLYGYP